jgi:dynein heavy chain
MTQLKSFTNPPPSAAVVMEGLCYAFGEDTNVKGKNKEAPTIIDFWDYAKKSLLNDKLIRRVKDIKIEQIRAMPPGKVSKLKQFVTNPLFDKERVFNASKAAGNLALWIRSVLETYEALMIIEPKKAELAHSELMLK